MVSIMMGAWMSFVLGLLFIYILIKKRIGYIIHLDVDYILLAFLIVIGLVVGVCYDFGFGPLLYATFGFSLSFTTSFIICYFAGLDEQMSGGMFQIFSDATLINILSAFCGTVGFFLYGIYSSM